MKTMSSSSLYEVVAPIGKAADKAKITPLSPGVPNLNGKTIGEVCHTHRFRFRADETFPMIEKLIRKQFSDVKFIPFDEMPDLPGTSEKEMADFGKVLKEKRIDILLSGNGG